MIVFDCPSCQTKLSAKDAEAGAVVRCPKCQTKLSVPRAMAVPPPPVPAIGAAAGFISGKPNLGTANAFRAATGGGRRYGFNCGYCSSRLEATEAMAAQDGQCPTCGNTITIPIQDRYGRLIDPKTRQIIKQDPHPVHAYAAAGDRAPKILRQDDGKQIIRCARCSTLNAITSNNCKACGMPFTMEGTTLEAAGTSNGFCVASLVLGIIGLPTFCAVVPSMLAIVFGIMGFAQITKASSEHSAGGRGMAIAGIACGIIGCMIAVYFYILK